MDTEFVKYLWESSLTAWGVVTFYFYRRDRGNSDREIAAVRTDLEATKTHAAKNSIDLSDFRLHVSEKYAKAESVTASFASLQSHIESGFSELRADIKKILAQTK
jgi:hypothetical protein